MNSTISKAIREKTVLEFYYKSVRRVVEPHTYGLDRKACVEKLSAYQLTGKPLDKPDWRYYEVAEIKNLRELPQSFQDSRDGYKRDDRRMSTIYERI